MMLVNWWLKLTGRNPVSKVVELKAVESVETIMLTPDVKIEPPASDSLICGQLVEVLGPSPSLTGAQGRIIHDFKNGDLFEVYIPKFSAGYILKRENLKPLDGITQ